MNLGYETFGRQHVLRFNNVPVQNLAHLAKMVEACQEGEMVFEFDRDEVIVLDAKAAHKATREVAAIHGIPASRSADLLPAGAGEGASPIA